LYKAAISVWTGFVRRGVKVFATTVPPSTTSTDSYMTTAKQTPTNPAFKAGTGAHWQWNTWLRDGAPMRGTLATGFTQVATGTTGADVLRTGQTGHLLTYLIDIAAALETSPGSGIYRPNLNGATEGWYAFDGVHPTDIGCNSIAAECGPALIAKLASLKA